MDEVKFYNYSEMIVEILEEMIENKEEIPIYFTKLINIDFFYNSKPNIFYNEENNNVLVGNGAFKDLVVCYYAIYGYYLTDNKKLISSNEFLLDDKGQNVSTYLLDKNKLKHKMDDKEIYIISNPYLRSKFNIGHKINYFINNELELMAYFNNLTKDNININVYGEKVIYYYLRAIQNCNCVLIHKNYYIYVKLIKNIEYGEELLLFCDYKFYCNKIDTDLLHEYFKEYLLSLDRKKQIYLEELFKNVCDIFETNPIIELNKEYTNEDVDVYKGLLKDFQKTFVGL